MTSLAPSGSGYNNNSNNSFFFNFQMSKILSSCKISGPRIILKKVENKGVGKNKYR